MISASSGLKARMESLEMLANNVANAGTAGFKSDREFYNVYTASEAELPVIEKQWTDHAQGTLLATGKPLDLAITGKGFFTVDGPNGPLYTRNGNFRMSPDGRILTADGHAVKVVRQDGRKVELDPQATVDIDGKGVIHQHGIEAGRLVLVEFGDESALAKAGNTYFKFDGPNPALAKAAEVHQGSLESSNVPASEAAVRLVNVMRQFEMLQRAMQIGGEMNRRAVEEVAKVS